MLVLLLLSTVVFSGCFFSKSVEEAPSNQKGIQAESETIENVPQEATPETNDDSNNEELNTQEEPSQAENLDVEDEEIDFGELI